MEGGESLLSSVELLADKKQIAIVNYFMVRQIYISFSQNH